MIATTAAIAEKKFSDRSDHTEISFQRSQQSQRQRKYQDALRTLTLLRMAANTNIEQAIYLALFMEGVQIYYCLCNKFSKEYREKYKKINCWKAIGEKLDLTLSMSSLSFPSSSTSKNTHNYRKHVSSRSRRFTATMLNLRNGANYVVRPRSPQSSFSDRNDQMDT